MDDFDSADVSSGRHLEKRPTAFVSYAQSSRRWQEDVLEFTIALRMSGGVDAEVDVFHRSDHQQWSMFGAGLIGTSDFTLIAIDAAYKRRWEGQEEQGVGAGVAREAAAIRAIFERDQKDFLKRIKVVLLPGAREQDIPDDLLGYCERFRIDSFGLEGLEDLLRSVYGKPAFPKPALGDIPALPPKAVARLEGKDSDEIAGGAASQGRGLRPEGTAKAVDARDEENLRDQLRGVRRKLGSLEAGPASGSRATRDSLLRERTALEVSLEALAQVRSDRVRARPRRRRSARAAARTWKGRVGGVGGLALALVGILAAGAGTAAAVRALSDDLAPPPRAIVARASGIEVKGPPGWRQQAGRAGISGLDIAAPVSVAPRSPISGSDQLTAVAGISNAAGASLLPAAFREQLGEQTRRTPVDLGSLDAYRYTGLETATGDPLAVFVAPTSIGVATVACRIPGGMGANRSYPPCDRIASTLRLTRGSAYPLGPSAALARALRKQLPRLDRRQTSALRKMSRAGGAGPQAAAAAELADAFRDTARGLASIRISPESEKGRAALVEAFRRLRDSYKTLAVAARREDGPAYIAAKRAVRAGERAVRQRLADLPALGYRVG